jgi:hypothetical protein
MTTQNFQITERFYRSATLALFLINIVALIVIWLSVISAIAS